MLDKIANGRFMFILFCAGIGVAAGNFIIIGTIAITKLDNDTRRVKNELLQISNTYLPTYPPIRRPPTPVRDTVRVRNSWPKGW